jgi:hypothetical protein
MRDTWYGDDRDLVKWGTLAHIAQRESLDLIVQVPYLRCGERPRLQTGKGEIQIQSPIWEFFRNVSAVKRLGESLGREVIVVLDPFDPRKREDYHQAVCERLGKLSESKVVLLDPDTGLAPKKAKAEHVTCEDVQAVWRVLGYGDWLVLYQHASRVKDWQKVGRLRFAAACGADDCEMFTAPDTTKDVAFLACPKRNV